MSEKKVKSVHEKMSVIKKELSKSKIPKSGNNKFAGFRYHELQDFMPFINDLNEKHGVNCVPRFLKKEGICTLKIVNTEDEQNYYEVVIPFVEAQMLAKGGSPSNVDAIQRMGSTLTYNRRYLYMSAYDIIESDGVDSLPPQEKPKTPPKEKAPAKPKPRNDGSLIVPTKADINAAIYHKMPIEEVVCVFKMNNEQCKKYDELLKSKNK